MKEILLVEPDYKNKFPPLGLMKIATAHKLLGDNVTFVKGCDIHIASIAWDTIYITTLFSFYWKKTIDTIKFYNKQCKDSEVLVGGVLATLLPEAVENTTGIKPHIGSFYGDIPNIINAIHHGNDLNLKELLPDIKIHGIDRLPPDYSIFNGKSFSYDKILKDSFILRTSQGCFRSCTFCSVSKIMPEYHQYINIKPTINYIRHFWGDKKNLLLLDDNFLYSEFINDIIDDIKDIGFYRNSTIVYKKLIIDFNQGIDLRLLNVDILKKLREIELKPLRIAFDDISLKEEYIEKVELAISLGFREISSYLLYNYNDTPEELYERMKVSQSLNAKHNCRIYSFPMKYIPTTDQNRKYIGKYWTKRQIRSFQCILSATHGIVPVKNDFFNNAFGKDLEEFLMILQMPENYIISRNKKQSQVIIQDWKNQFQNFTTIERNSLITSISMGKNNLLTKQLKTSVKYFLNQHYKNETMAF